MNLEVPVRFLSSELVSCGEYLNLEQEINLKRKLVLVSGVFSLVLSLFDAYHDLGINITRPGCDLGIALTYRYWQRHGMLCVSTSSKRNTAPLRMHRQLLTILASFDAMYYMA